MIFKIGDKVSLLEETGVYTILDLRGPSATVMDEHGFELKVDQRRLVQRKPLNVSAIIKDYAVKSKLKPFKKMEEIPQIDLHAEALGLDQVPPHELLTKQIEVCKSFINTCINHRVGKALVIHGVGDGTLRNAVRQMLQHRSGISCHDGNYSSRGVGSTLVLLSISKVEKL